jgi:hypothetical protein
MKVKKIGSVGGFAALIPVPENPALETTKEYLFNLHNELVVNMTAKEKAAAKKIYNGIVAAMKTQVGMKNGLNVQVQPTIQIMLQLLKAI